MQKKNIKKAREISATTPARTLMAIMAPVERVLLFEVEGSEVVICESADGFVVEAAEDVVGVREEDVESENCIDEAKDKVPDVLEDAVVDVLVVVAAAVALPCIVLTAFIAP